MMQKNPRVSVIMPAYNHEKFVGEAVDSVLGQTFRDFEFIIINDGSTDRTEEVIRNYTDARINYFAQSNKGAPSALNRGLSVAKGKYISIINSDDVYHPDRLEFLHDAAESDTLKFLITDVIFIDAYSELIKEPLSIISWHKRVKDIYSDTGSLFRVFLRSNMAVSSSNFFFDSAIVNDIGMFSRYRYVHDYDFLFRVLCRYESKFRFFNGAGYLCYRVHSGNTINNSLLLKHVEDLCLHFVNTLRYIKVHNFT